MFQLHDTALDVSQGICGISDKFIVMVSSGGKLILLENNCFTLLKIKKQEKVLRLLMQIFLSQYF